MDQLHRFDHSNFIVPPNTFTPLSSFDPGYTGQLGSKKHGKRTLQEDVEDLAKAQELIWALKEFGVLIIFQAMDAAGKDGTIKHVMSGINPQGCDVFGFKAPSEEERLHHFLWRPYKYLPVKGKISIFNRSYYEEVLVVRVHPEMLDKQWIRKDLRNAPLEDVWQSRYEEINEFEKRLANHDTIVIKFFLHLSKEEQLKRFLSRLNTKGKEWKFSESDYSERKLWDDYQQAYEQMLNSTSTSYAPWYVVPADNKWYLRAVVADVISKRVDELDLKYPTVSEEKMARLAKVREELEEELMVMT